MSNAPAPRVLVGYDGSTPARAALAWAVRHARDAQWPLVIAMAADQPIGTHIGQGPGLPPGVSVDEAERNHLDEVCAAAQEAAGSVPVEARFLEADPAGHLVAESGEPGVVVIGTRGLGAVRSLWRGGTADGVVTRTRGPLVVVPEGGHEAHGPVVVGVDPAGDCRPAMDYAVAAARRARVPLIVVLAWPVDAAAPVTNPLAVLPAQLDTPVEEAEAVLNKLLDELRARADDVEIEGRISSGAPDQAIVDASREAGLVVIGSRGRGALVGLVAGSTSRRTAQRSRCPAVVVPDALSVPA